MKTAEEVLREIGKGTISKSVAVEAMESFAAQSVREDRESRWISASNPPVIPDGDDFVRLLLRANGHVLFGKYERDEDTGECHYIES